MEWMEEGWTASENVPFFHTCVSPVRYQTRRWKGGARIHSPSFFNLAIVMVMHSVSFTRSRGGEGRRHCIVRAYREEGAVVVVRHGCTCAPLWSRKDCSNFKGGLFYEHFNPTESNTG